MLGWGASTMGLGGAHNNAQVTGIRFLLGDTSISTAFIIYDNSCVNLTYTPTVMESGLLPGNC